MKYTVLLIWIIVSPLLGINGAAREAEAATVETDGEKGLTLTVEPAGYTIESFEREGIPWRQVVQLGAARLGEAGRPDLPLETYLVGLPENHTVRVRITDSRFEDLPGSAIAPALTEIRLSNGDPGQSWEAESNFYRSSGFYPEQLVSVGEPVRLRHQRAIPVRIAPFQFDPSSGLLRRYTMIELAVDFIPIAPEERRRTTGGNRPRQIVEDEGRWEGVYRGALVNYKQAKGFRSRLRTDTPSIKRSLLETEYKLLVRKSGLYRIDFSDLSAKGFPAGRDVSTIALYRRGWSDSLFEAGENPFTQSALPLLVEDADQDQAFNGDDYIVAHLPGFREDRMERDFDDRYAEEAVYFLSTEGSPHPFESRDGDRAFNGLTSLVSFPDSIRWEIDAVYNVNSPSDTVDLYFAMDERAVSRITEIDLPPPDTTKPYTIKAMTVGRPESNGGFLFHRYMLIHEASGDTVLNSLVNGGKAWQTRSADTLSGSHLSTGNNRYMYRGSRGPTPQTTIPGAFGYLDWYEIHGSFLYRARNNYAGVSSGDATGPVQMEIGGFTNNELYLFDVTDPYNAVRVLVDSTRTEGNKITLHFQDDVDRPRRYVAATTDGLPKIAASAIIADTPTSIASDEGNYLIISHEKFYDAAAPLADYRQSVGYEVNRVKIGDVYDEFNGGVKDPRAIRRYLRYGFERWNEAPGWVVLVGDGFEDYKGIATNNSWNREEFDYIPAYPFYQGDIVGSGDRWDVSDAWYGLFHGDHDPLIDILIGRFPVKEPEEVEAVVEKIVSYENFGPDDSWRNRLLFVADDEWTFTSTCMRDEDQLQFRLNTELYIRELKRSAARGIDTVNVFLSRFTEGEGGIHSLCSCDEYPGDGKWADLRCTVDNSRILITPRLFDEMNRGALLINFQGHGNRELLTHEVIVRQGYDYLGGDNRYSRDINELTEKNGKPYIFMAFGCSISEFERWQTQGGESITEEMLRFENGGAVAAFGSTGIEYLGPNLLLNESILKYFYKTPGSVPGGLEDAPTWYSGSPRWSLGEILVLGMNDFAIGYPTWEEVIKRYVLFGDPALELDAGAPAFEVTVDGNTAQDGQSLLGNTDGSPLVIEARIHDEVRIDRDSISLFERGVAVDTSLWSIEIDSSTATDGRAWLLRYETTVETIDRYDVVMRAVDRNDRAGTFTLSVIVDVEITFDGLSIAPGELVSPTPEIVISITTPLPVGQDDLGVELDGSTVRLDSTGQVSDFKWVVLVRPTLDNGSHDLTVTVRGQSKTFSFRVDGDFQIVNLLNYPNPFPEETGFFYELTDFADRMELEIFTVGGKRIRHITRLGNRAGYNRNPDLWDHRDQDGDEVANGVYIYRLNAYRGSDRARATGKAVVRKEPGSE